MFKEKGQGLMDLVCCDDVIIIQDEDSSVLEQGYLVDKTGK